MKVIIAGSRTIWSYKKVCKAITFSGFNNTTVISGDAQGIDKIAIIWALLNKRGLQKMKADWKKFGKSAGMIRNNHMAKEAEALIAVWDGTSPGTKHMINLARKLGLKVYVLIVRGSLHKPKTPGFIQI